MALIIVILISAAVALAWAHSISSIDPLLIEYYKEVENYEEPG